MMKRWFCLLLLLFMLLQLLCACQVTPHANSSADDLDSCAQTSGYRMAETKDGFYLSIWNRLYYADKADLTNWVPLCSEPRCDHTQSICISRMAYEEFYIKGERIYTIRHLDALDQINAAQGQAVVSTKLDGSDIRVEFELEGSSTRGEGYINAILTPECAYGQYYEMQNDGHFKATVVRSNEDGTEILFEQSLEALTGLQYFESANTWYGMRGNFCLLSAVAAKDESGSFTSEKKLFQSVGSGLEEISGIEGLNRYGAYWDGNTMYYKSADGYYRFDSATALSKKYLDANSRNATGYYLEPDHIIETNYNSDVPGSDAVMAVYHEGEWNEITIPEELLTMQEGSFSPLSLSADGMFFTVFDFQTAMYHLYRIPLDGNTNTAILCGSFSA